MFKTEIERIIKESEVKMQSAIDSMKKQFLTIRTGRAHPSLVENIKVDYYGTKTPIKQLANISTPEPRMIVIQPWDKGSMTEIEKAINISDLGISPINDGKLIRLSMPQLTKERREELVKVLHKIAEESKVSIRNVRHEANEEANKLEKGNLLTEDDKFLAKEKIQKLTNDYSKRLEDILAEKEKEVKN